MFVYLFTSYKKWLVQKMRIPLEKDEIKEDFFNLYHVLKQPTIIFAS